MKNGLSGGRTGLWVAGRRVRRLCFVGRRAQPPSRGRNGLGGTRQNRAEGRSHGGSPGTCSAQPHRRPPRLWRYAETS